MNRTGIAWTDFSSNPLKYRRRADGQVVCACVKVSPGCAHCYSEAIGRRFGRGEAFTAANMEGLAPVLDEGELRQMARRRACGGRAVAGGRCFVGDMTDLFGPWVPDALLDRLFAVLALRRDVTWQLLTKRADRAREYLSGLAAKFGRLGAQFPELPWRPWPLSNVWLGVSVEGNAQRPRIEALKRTPAAIRFLSLEPLLEDIDLIGPGDLADCPETAEYNLAHYGASQPIAWVIVGGESGPHRRPCDPTWVQSVRDQCQAAGVPCFVKQGGDQRPGRQGDLPDALFAVKEFPA
jgi:protein gp37